MIPKRSPGRKPRYFAAPNIPDPPYEALYAEGWADDLDPDPVEDLSHGGMDYPVEWLADYTLEVM